MELGFDFITLTGNPSSSVTNEAIIEALKVITPEVNEKMFMIAGKMHAAGFSNESGENIISKETIEAFINSGADIHHIGDAAIGGMDAENLMHYSEVIRGKRHTILRMARSIYR